MNEAQRLPFMRWQAGGTPLPSDVIAHLSGHAPLQSVAVPVSLGVVLLGSAGALVWRAHRRRRRGVRATHLWLRRTGALTWVICLLLLTVGAAVNRYVGYVPSVQALVGQLNGHPDAGILAAGAGPLGSSRSQLSKVEIPGTVSQLPTLGAYIYLPAGYHDAANVGRHYPVLYLIHGSPGWPIDWFRAADAGNAMDTLLARSLVQPMIIVGPTANLHFLDDSECLNAVAGPQIETYLTSDVVAYVDSHYRTIAARAARAIGGISAGGFCALNLGLRHQDEFSVVLAHMPYGDPGNVMHRLLGDDQKLYDANSPIRYLPGFAFRQPQAFFLDAGQQDPTVTGQTRRMAAMLTAKHQTVDLRVVPGESHTWHLGRDELPYSLLFASQQFALQARPPAQVASAVQVVGGVQPAAGGGRRPRR